MTFAVSLHYSREHILAAKTQSPDHCFIFEILAVAVGIGALVKHRDYHRVTGRASAKGSLGKPGESLLIILLEAAVAVIVVTAH